MKSVSTIKRIGYGGISLLAVLSASSVLLSAPVYARGGSDDTTQSTSTTSSTSRPASSEATSGSGVSPNSGSRQGALSGGTTVKIEDSTTSKSNEPELETHNALHDTTAVRVGSLEDKAKELLNSKRAESGKKSTVADRQKACTEHQGEVDTHFARYSSDAKKALSTYDAVFTKVQAYQSTNKLSVANYDALVADATAKQVAAQGAVSALASVSTTIDCTTTDPAASIGTVKSAVATAKSALKEYRTAIKTIIVALLAAKPTTTEGTN